MLLVMVIFKYNSPYKEHIFRDINDTEASVIFLYKLTNLYAAFASLLLIKDKLICKLSTKSSQSW